MKHLQTLAALGVAVASVCLVANAQTNEWEKRTVLTVNAPIEIPGHVLPAGTYVMMLNNSPSDRHIVQVFDKDQKHSDNHYSGDPELSSAANRKNCVYLLGSSSRPAQGASRMVLSGRQLWPRVRVSQTGSNEDSGRRAHASVPTTSATSNEELATAPVNSTNESGVLRASLIATLTQLPLRARIIRRLKRHSPNREPRQETGPRPM